MNKLAQIEFKETEREISIPLAVVLERSIDNKKKWVLPHWQVFTVLTGEHNAKYDQGSRIYHDETNSRFFWGGMVLHLFKDGSEGYWYNLLSNPPYLFIICDGDEGDMELEPAFITANQDEANGYMEADRLVLSSPMPEEICDILEHYVISHYQPAKKKKRKRQVWVEESIYGKRPRLGS